MKRNELKEVFENLQIAMQEVSEEDFKSIFDMDMSEDNRSSFICCGLNNYFYGKAQRKTVQRNIFRRKKLVKNHLEVIETLRRMSDNSIHLLDHIDKLSRRDSKDLVDLVVLSSNMKGEEIYGE